MRRRLLRFLERAVTPRDYFHTPHPAELAWDDPLRSYHYDLRRKADFFLDVADLAKAVGRPQTQRAPAEV